MPQLDRTCSLCGKRGATRIEEPNAGAEPLLYHQDCYGRLMGATLRLIHIIGVKRVRLDRLPRSIVRKALGT